MAPPNNPLICRVALIGNRDTRQWVNTFHVHRTGGWTITDMTNLAVAFKTWWDTYIKPVVNNQTVLDVIAVRLLDPSNPLALDFTTGLPITGTYSGPNNQPAPANVSLATSWRTGLAGRKFRGRYYFPAIADGYITSDDRISSGFVTTLITIASQLLSAMLSGSFDLVVFHRSSNLYTLITNFVVEAILDSQRRRLPARGR